jgi:hypothetical protein
MIFASSFAVFEAGFSGSFRPGSKISFAVGASGLLSARAEGMTLYGSTNSTRRPGTDQLVSSASTARLQSELRI